MTGGGRSTFSQSFSLLALTVWERRWFEDLEENGHGLNELLNESMNDKGLCRRAAATQGLLNIHTLFINT